MRRFAMAGQFPLRCSMLARILVAVPWLFCCVSEETPLGPPGKNMTGAVTSTTVDGGETEAGSETGTPDDMTGCDPLADPEDECGTGMDCDLDTHICGPALGNGIEGDLCANDDECGLGLVCSTDRCRGLCDAETGDGCEDAQICAAAVAPIPGVCLDRCQLILNTCTFPGDACKRVLGPNGDLFAACVPNPGFGAPSDACNSDPDCAAGNLCTPAATHTLPCANEAPSCCTPICDNRELPCFGFDPVCYALSLDDQPNTGYCGVE
jgi:hypothetical protein